MHYRLNVKRPNLLFLILLISFPSVATVLLSPALPAIRAFFHTSNSMAQQVITLAILGYAIGQLIYSPLANRFGRKPAIYIGMALYLASSLVCLIAVFEHTMTLLLIGRFFMALGASVGMVITFTLINDFYYPEQARPVVAYTVLAYAFMPGLAILLGGFITSHLSWVDCFYFLIIYGLLVTFSSSFLPETLLKKDESALKLKPLLHAFNIGFSNWRLILFSSIYGLMGAFIYITASGAPFIGIDDLGLTPLSYGLLLLLPYCGQFIGALLAGKLSKKYSGYVVLTIGFSSTAFGSLLMLTTFLLHLVNIYTLLIPLFFIMMGLPMSYSTVTVMALSEYKEKATGSAVMSFVTMGISLIATVVYTLLPGKDANMMPYAFTAVLLIVFIAIIHAYCRYKT